MKRERGITLIALVITIIVLLILAGVSISLVVGNNGVLTQATDAVEKNRESAAMEDVQMAWASATSEYWTDWATDSSKNISDYRTKSKLDSYLVGKGYLEGEPRYNDTDKEYTVKYRAIDQNELYTFLITEDGKARKKTGVILSSSELTIEPNETATLTVKLVEMPRKTNDDIIWSSSDTSKVTVENGIVTGVANGTVTITATCDGKSDTCDILVAAKLANYAVNYGYVNINIGYLDQYNSNDYRTTSTGASYVGNAWRILSKNTTSGVVKLISTGHPLTFNHPSGSDSSNVEASISELQTIKDGPITLHSRGRGYVKNGFDTLDIAGLFSNRLIYSGVSIPVWDGEAIRVSGTPLWTGCYWYFAAGTDSGLLRYGTSAGSTAGDGERPTRPVVTLVPGVTIKDGDGSSDSPYRLNGIDY